MSALSTIRKIFMLTTGDKFNPITTTSTQAQSIEDAMFAVPVPVGSAAERVTVWGNTPVQGASVFRRDTGDTERYFDTYSAQSNPGGRTPAGWYPENVKVRTAFYNITGSTGAQNTLAGWTNITPVASKTVNNDFCTIPSSDRFRLRDGLYSITMTFLSQGSSIQSRSFIEMIDAAFAGDAGIMARASIPVQEDRTSLSITYYIVGTVDVYPRFYKNSTVASTVPTGTMSITKIG